MPPFTIFYFKTGMENIQNESVAKQIAGCNFVNLTKYSKYTVGGYDFSNVFLRSIQFFCHYYHNRDKLQHSISFCNMALRDVLDLV